MGHSHPHCRPGRHARLACQPDKLFERLGTVGSRAVRLAGGGKHLSLNAGLGLA